MKTPIRILKAAAVALAAAFLTFAAEAVTIDPAKVTVVTREPKREAVKDFLTHFELITGVKAQVVATADKVPAGNYPIFLREAPEGAPKESELKPEEARWRVTDKGIWIWGHSLHGGDYAIYSFLEDALGCRWVWKTESAWFHQNPIVLAEKEHSWAPELKIRKMRAKPYDIWRERLRDGGHDVPPFGHAFTGYWGLYGQTGLHPEWFSMREDGKRMPVGFSDATAKNPAASKDKPARFIAMCVSNDEYRDHVVDVWRGVAQDKEGEVGKTFPAKAEKDLPLYINLCENDASGENSCHCPKCEALDAPRPADGKDWWVNWLSDRYINFSKGILERARKYRKDVRVIQYAYNAVELPPRREKWDDSITVGLVPVHFSYDAIKEYVQGWKKVGMKLFFHRPNRRCYYSQSSLPVGFDKHFFNIFKYLVDEGCMGFMYEDGTSESTFGWLADYVIEKGMQDPSKDFEYWEDHYCQAFGPAKDDVKGYYRYWRQEVWEKRIEKDMEKIADVGKYFNFTRGLLFLLGNYYQPEDFTKANAFLEKALARTDLEPQTRALVQKLYDDAKHSELYVNCLTWQSEDCAKALLEWRTAHKRGAVTSGENHFGDILAVKRYMEASPANYKMGGKYDGKNQEVAICNWQGKYTKETAELKKVLDYLFARDLPVYTKDEDQKFVEKAKGWVVPEKYTFYVGRVPFKKNFDDIQFMEPEEGHFMATMYEGCFFWGKDNQGVANGIRKFLEHELCCRWPWEDEFALVPKAHNGMRIYTRREFDWKRPFPHKIVEKKVVRDEGMPFGLERELYDEWEKALEAKKPFKLVFDGKMSVYDWFAARMIDYRNWDPEKPFEYWEPRYMQAFGCASVEVMKYFRYWRTALAGGKKPTKAMFAEAGKFLDAALARTDFRGRDKSRVERVKREHDAAAAKCK